MQILHDMVEQQEGYKLFLFGISYFNPRKKPYLLFLALATWVPNHSQKSIFIQNIVYSVGKI